MAKAPEALPKLTTVSKRENWHILHGKKRWSTGTSVREHAQVQLQQYIAGLGGVGALRKRSKITTIDQLLDEWKKEFLRKGDRERANWERNWKYLQSTILRHATNTPLHLVDKDWGDDYVGARLDEGVVGPTVRKELAHIRAAWESFSHRIEIQKPNFNMPPAGKARNVFITPDQARNLFAAAANWPHTQMFIRLGWATAGRHGALLNLRWSSIDFEACNIDLTEGAHEGGKGAAIVRIGPGMVKFLRDAREHAETPYAVEMGGRAPLGSVKNSFRSCVQAAGLPAWVTPHILRHSAATQMAKSGVDMHKIQGFLGHSSIETTTKIYAHHSPDFQSDAAAALEL